jgi:signal peptidase II
MKTVPRNRYVWFGLLSILGLAIDLGSKEWVFGNLGYPGQSSDWVYGFFGDWGKVRFLTSINEGALWGMGQGYTWLFALLSVIAVAGVTFWLFGYGAARSLWLTIALGLIMAGTLGNLYDRLGIHGCVRPDGSAVYGVRDFLAFTFGTYHYPIFNPADCFLVTGAIMLAIQSFRGDELVPQTEEPAAGTRVTATTDTSSLAGRISGRA